MTGAALSLIVFGAAFFVDYVLESTCESREARLCTPTAFWGNIEFKANQLSKQRRRKGQGEEDDEGGARTTKGGPWNHLYCDSSSGHPGQAKGRLMPGRRSQLCVPLRRVTSRDHDTLFSSPGRTCH